MLARKYKGVVGLVGFLIGVLVAIIIAGSVVIPTIDSTMSTNAGSFTNYSSAQILINLSPLLIAVVLVSVLLVGMRLTSEWDSQKKLYAIILFLSKIYFLHMGSGEKGSFILLGFFLLHHSPVIDV